MIIQQPETEFLIQFDRVYKDTLNLYWRDTTCSLSQSKQIISTCTSLFELAQQSLMKKPINKQPIDIMDTLYEQILVVYKMNLQDLIQELDVTIMAGKNLAHDQIKKCAEVMKGFNIIFKEMAN